LNNNQVRRPSIDLNENHGSTDPKSAQNVNVNLESVPSAPEASKASYVFLNEMLFNFIKKNFFLERKNYEG
jgi:hypothetical protein